MSHILLHIFITSSVGVLFIVIIFVIVFIFSEHLCYKENQIIIFLSTV